MIAVSACGIGKRYRQYHGERTWTLQQAVLSGFRNDGRAGEFWSLRDASFEVAAGSALGVVGRNGAGKSTLLRLIAGVSRPDEGTLAVRGRLGGLLELTAGFHPDLTGRDNAFIGGVIRGLLRSEVERRFESIVEFAELANAIDRPVGTYSGGMQMRLAFSVAIHAEPEVLLVDEVLAVGDAAFQRKCLDKIAAMRAGGCTIIMVSHDAALVQQVCDVALWLREGRVAGFGRVGQVVDDYMRSISRETVHRTPEHAGAAVTSQGMVLVPGRNRFGSLDIAICDVRVSTSDGSMAEISRGHHVFVEMDYLATSTIDSPIFCITVVDDGNKTRLTASTDQAGYSMPATISRGTLAVRLELPDLEPGTYFIDVGVYENHWAYAYDYHARVYPLIVRHDRWQVPAARGNAGHSEWVHTPRSE